MLNKHGIAETIHWLERSQETTTLPITNNRPTHSVHLDNTHPHHHTSTVHPQQKQALPTGPCITPWQSAPIPLHRSITPHQEAQDPLAAHPQRHVKNKLTICEERRS